MTPKKILLGAIGTGFLTFSACQHFQPPMQDKLEAACGEPVSSRDASLEAMACDLDHIEKHIDLWGSITTKHPDVWGAARLTKYQQEVEIAFAQDANYNTAKTMVETYQGARARSDQAFLASAVALNLALSGKQAALLAPDPVTTITGTTTIATGDKFQRDTTSKNSSNASKDFSIERNSTQPAPTEGSSGNSSNTKITKEGKSSKDRTSETSRNLSSDTQNTLNQNTAVPSAVTIPDTKIPDGFLSLSSSTTNVNGSPATLGKMPEFGPNGIQLEPSIILDERKRFFDHLNQIRRINEGDDTSASPGYALYLMRVPVSVLPGKKTDSGHGAEITMSVKPIIGDDLLPTTFRNLVINDMVDQFSELLVATLNNDRETMKQLLSAYKVTDVNNKQYTVQSNQSIVDISKGLFTVNAITRRAKPKYTAARQSRNAEYAYPMTHLDELFKEEYVRALVCSAAQRYKDEILEGRVIHLQDMRAVVREQVVAALRFLTIGNPDGWSYCTQDLARAVRDLNGNIPTSMPTIREYYNRFDEQFGRDPQFATDIGSDRLAIKAMAWGVLIEAALLNDQLVRDIRETMTNKGITPTADGWLNYYHPTPCPQARQAFNEYVNCRWPMYTFAVDPVVEQQNIQDSLSQRRELQLALSLAFASGNISASNFTSYARRLEADYSTVDLNRTVVGFSHGDNTFGWRFFPRFQTPEIPSNLKVITRDLIGGKAFNTAQELRQRRLEPGQRECVALVIMPSFVPFAELNVSSSWFNLADPKHKSHSTQETVKLSRRLHAIETCNPPNFNVDQYRSGEFGRLVSKSQMLAARLPLQDMKFQVPFENTIGGFEFFNSGITDLTPQLRGWYGAAGYNGLAVELFLMGDHFSVNNTTVVAGGMEVASKLISRQIVRVSLPANLAQSEGKAGVDSESGKYIEVRLATPYGIGTLRIPVLNKPVAPPLAPTLNIGTDSQQIILDQDTEIAIVGTNFTADMQVLVGGVSVDVTVLSPTTAKVVVPKGVVSTDPAGRQLELKVVTPGGVSNAITLTIFKTQQPTADPRPAPAFKTTTFEIGYQYKNLGIAAVNVPNRRPELVIDMQGLTPGDDIAITFKSSADKIVVSENLKYNAKANTITGFSESLMGKLFAMYASRFGPENVNPVQPITFTAKISWVGPDKKPVEFEVTNTLTVKWVRVVPK